nr:PREDICTED: mediator of RNA polymerase II transcription subunit 9 isoform X2 [Musa acuminata subsp. malaccensis]
MDHQYNGGSWMMIPNQNPLNQDFHSLQPQYPPPPLLSQPQQQPQQQQQQHHHHPSLASHFHLLSLVERLADAIDSGGRDQQYEALTVEGQKRRLEETMQQLNQRRDLVVKYRSHVEELVKPERNR